MHKSQDNFQREQQFVTVAGRKVVRKSDQSKKLKDEPRNSSITIDMKKVFEEKARVGEAILNRNDSNCFFGLEI